MPCSRETPGGFGSCTARSLEPISARRCQELRGGGGAAARQATPFPKDESRAGNGQRGRRWETLQRTVSCGGGAAAVSDPCEMTLPWELGGARGWDRGVRASPAEHAALGSTSPRAAARPTQVLTGSAPDALHFCAQCRQECRSLLGRSRSGARGSREGGIPERRISAWERERGGADSVRTERRRVSKGQAANQWPSQNWSGHIACGDTLSARVVGGGNCTLRSVGNNPWDGKSSFKWDSLYSTRLCGLGRYVRLATCWLFCAGATKPFNVCAARGGAGGSKLQPAGEVQ